MDEIDAWKASLRDLAKREFELLCKKAPGGDKSGDNSGEDNKAGNDGEWLDDAALDEVVREHILGRDIDVVNDKINSVNEAFMVRVWG